MELILYPYITVLGTNSEFSFTGGNFLNQLFVKNIFGFLAITTNQKVKNKNKF